MADLFSAEPDALPIISLWQPWASLCFVLEPAHRKTLETRGRRYPSKYDGKRVGFHAAASYPPRRLISDELHELAIAAFGVEYRRTLPLGALVGTVVLGSCLPSEVLREHIGFADRIAGDWRDERFGWRLDSPQLLPAPVPMKGKQGWWSTPIDEIEGLLA